MAGISSHSQDGDRIENPSNTGRKIHGDFSAPIVSELGTTGDSPAAITRISSGVTAAMARQHAEYRHRRPAGPAIVSRSCSQGRSRTRRGACPAAQHDEADQADEGHAGEAGGQRDRGSGQGQHQPVAEPGHAELLHQ
jgi:hypothetical protein